jgi:YqjK-like protein
MSAKLRELALRRERLTTSAAAQRARLAQQYRYLHYNLRYVDRGFAVLRFMRSHKAIIAGTLAGLVALRPKLAWRWTRRLAGFLRIGRQVLTLARLFARRAR